MRAVVDQMVLSFSEGKGGGFFFWSIDRRFMVKTLEPNEYAKLRGLLPAYYRHMWTRRRSLLPRFYGAYSITIQNHEKLCGRSRSSARRRAERSTSATTPRAGSTAIGVGGTAARSRTWTCQAAKLADGIAEGLLDDLRHDTQLLCSHNLMDYSLLLGVHNQAVATEGLPGLKVKTTDGGVVADEVDVPGYYMGLIDILQAWNLSKRIERYSKIVFKGRWAKEVKDGMSAIEPTAYRERFLAGIGHQLGVTRRTAIHQCEKTQHVRQAGGILGERRDEAAPPPADYRRRPGWPPRRTVRRRDRSPRSAGARPGPPAPLARKPVSERVARTRIDGSRALCGERSGCPPGIIQPSEKQSLISKSFDNPT